MKTLDYGGSRPGATLIGTGSTDVLPPNEKRLKAEFVNDSTQDIYLAKGTPAALNRGIRLNANGGSYTIEPDNQGRIWKGSISAISATGSANLTWCEDW